MSLAILNVTEVNEEVFKRLESIAEDEDFGKCFEIGITKSNSSRVTLRLNNNTEIILIKESKKNG